MFRNAIVANHIPKSLPANALRTDKYVVINYAKACQQHTSYVNVCQQMGLQVIEVDVSDEFPDSVFVEDIVVIIDDKALITNPGHPSRQGEKDAVREAIKKHTNLKIFEMDGKDELLDGGDVMFTGKEIFIGLSQRTNVNGYEKLKTIFENYPCHSIYVSGTLHLKSVVSTDFAGNIFVGPSSTAIMIKNQITALATHKYTYVPIMDDAAANIVAANGNLMFRKDYQNSYQNYDGKHNKIYFVDGSELAKVDGALTCCSVLF